MERDFGSEMVRTFGVRLKRIYEPDEASLPREMVAVLDNLKRAEAELVARAALPSPAAQPSQDSAEPGA